MCRMKLTSTSGNPPAANGVDNMGANARVDRLADLHVAMPLVARS